jgi:catechol 2,3-dioxygenase-like lactoylglutathione lyase family enzyme
MIKARRLAHATFEVADLEAEISYYEEVIGLTLVSREAGRAFLATEVGQVAIVLHQGPAAQCTTLAFEIAAEAGLAEAAHRLSHQGIACETVSDPVPGIRDALTFTDAKGTAIELFSAWDFVEPTGTPRGVNPVKLGHLAFMVPDPKATADYYERTLGFRVSDWIEDWFVFLRSGVEHHTVNFIRGSAARMHHIAFELRDASHMHRACDLLGRHKIPILWGPVRHGPGHNVAVYHRNAGGHLVEFFIDLDEMVDEELGYYEPRPWHRDRPQRPKVWGDPPRDIWGLPPLPEFMRDR